MTNTIIALCGNKCDLPKETWRVDSESARKFAAASQVLFFETSAKENINISEVFQALAEAYFDQNAGPADGPAGISLDDPQPRQRKCC